jgi:uncharacterized membrane protein YkoI
MKLVRFHTLAALGAVVTSPLAAQQDSTHGSAVRSVARTQGKGKAKKENLKSLAKISKDSAKTVALSKVAAGSKVKSSELEREKGTVVYSFDITVPGQTGVEEILVSAIDGSVVSQEHETPAQEKAEKKKEKAEKKKG